MLAAARLRGCCPAAARSPPVQWQCASLPSASLAAVDGVKMTAAQRAQQLPAAHVIHLAGESERGGRGALKYLNNVARQSVDSHCPHLMHMGQRQARHAAHGYQGSWQASERIASMLAACMCVHTATHLARGLATQRRQRAATCLHHAARGVKQGGGVVADCKLARPAGTVVRAGKVHQLVPAGWSRGAGWGCQEQFIVWTQLQEVNFIYGCLAFRCYSWQLATCW